MRNAHRLRAQAGYGHPEPGTASGLVACLDDEPRNGYPAGHATHSFKRLAAG